ncbi:hypothetical protein SBA7_360003 [Candidatus Sulfotelmatobacter sp. SbA7]|nr:hypothetical protein SBA7_360003 [Candidatus Sulfotelmatobacter sp. SbA7]
MPSLICLGQTILGSNSEYLAGASASNYRETYAARFVLLTFRLVCIKGRNSHDTRRYAETAGQDRPTRRGANCASG